MKHKQAPSPAPERLNASRLAQDPQVKAFAKRLTGDPAARATDLSEEQLTFVYREVLKRRDPSLDPSDFERAMRETTQVLSAPESRWTLDDLNDHILTQPEMQHFRADWQARPNSSGPRPNHAGTKAVLTCLAMSGISSHLDDAITVMRGSEGLRRTFAGLDGAAQAKALPYLPGLDPDIEPLAIPSYSRISRHARVIARPGVEAAWKANVAMLKALQQMYPEVGKRLLIDGTRVPAWCRQTGAVRDGVKNEGLEAELRRHTPEAGFRAYHHTPSGKRSVDPNEKLPVAASTKKWRGYHAVGIFDQATGLLIIGDLIDAATDEAWMLVPLLSKLFALWPELDGHAELIAGDSAWDEDEWCRLCEANYGLHPIFRLHGDPSTVHATTEKDSRFLTVAGWNHLGQLRCRRMSRSPWIFSVAVR